MRGGTAAQLLLYRPYITTPRCCAGERCEFPSLGLHGGGPGGIKNCPDCGEKIHDVCAFEDGEARLSETNVCPDRWDARKPPAEVNLPTGRTRRSSELSSLARWTELAFEERISAIHEGRLLLEKWIWIMP
jgi:hypothetical protein